MKDKSIFQRTVLLLGLVGFSAMAIVLSVPMDSPGAEDKMPIPPKLQAVMFQKIFRFDKTLAEKEIKILIIHGEETPEIMGELKEEFEKVEIPVETAKVSELEAKIEGVTVIYVLPGVETEPVKKLCTEQSLLSISGLSELAEKGEVSVVIGEEGGKPKIMINMNQLKAEGHELSAELLKLAKVIK